MLGYYSPAISKSSSLTISPPLSGIFSVPRYSISSRFPFSSEYYEFIFISSASMSTSRIDEGAMRKTFTVRVFLFSGSPKNFLIISDGS